MLIYSSNVRPTYARGNSQKTSFQCDEIDGKIDTNLRLDRFSLPKPSVQ